MKEGRMGTKKKSLFARYAKIFVVLSVVAASSSGIFGRVIGASPMAIGFWRMTIVLPFFAVPVLLRHRDTLRDISKKDCIWSFISGIFLFWHFLSWFSSVKLTNIASASVIASLHPLVVLIVTVFVLKRKVGFRAVMGIVAALFGGALIAGLNYSVLSSGNSAGDMMAFLAAVFMGLYFSIGNEVRKNVPGSTYIAIVFFSCWICFVLGMAATKTPAFGYPPRDYLFIVLLTLACQLGAHAVLNFSFGYVDSLYVSAWMSGESVFAIIMGIVFLKQIPALWEIIGSAVAISGLLYYNYSVVHGEKGKA